MNTNLSFNQNGAELNFMAHKIVEVLKKKSKKLTTSESAYFKQAQIFTPYYLDFISKVIDNNQLKIVYGSEGYIERISHKDKANKQKETDFLNKLSRKAANRIHVDIRKADVLPHELGHAVDFMFGFKNSLTNRVLLSGGKTLNEIFTEEFNSKQKELYHLVFDEYKEVIDSNIHEGAFDILKDYMDDYNELIEIPINKVKKDRLARKRLQKALYESGFVDVYYCLTQRQCFQLLNKKYSTILDALSSKYDFANLFLHHHDNNYYYLDEQVTEEFFANVFAAKVTGDLNQLSFVEKLLPKSYMAFEELFNICFERISNNKRFNNLQLRERN